MPAASNCSGLYRRSHAVWTKRREDAQHTEDAPGSGCTKYTPRNPEVAGPRSRSIEADWRSDD
jgi:hypothetical protein